MNVEIIGSGNVTSDDFYPSFLIENILVNVPSGTLKELKRKAKNLKDLNIIIITHLNASSFYELPQILYHEYVQKRTEPLILIGPRELKKMIIKLLKMMYGLNFLSDLDITFVDALTVQKANFTKDYRFSFINLKHQYLKTCYALIISKGNATLGYIGETKLCPGLSYLLKEVKNCIINIDKDNKNTLGTKELLDLTRSYNINFIPVGYPAELADEINEIKNVKVIKSGEQFYI